MEVEEIQAQPNTNNNKKLPRTGNGQTIDTEPGNKRQIVAVPSAIDTTSNGRLRGWHHSSRIIRVSRASGGKDRHSKVWTSKGLRDRRVRLSVTTAIQFYDLQDRLGYDQPSKAVEWLINAAADSISELPSLNTAAFPDTPKQLSDEKRPSAEHAFDSGDVGLDDPNLQHHNHQQQQHLFLSKPACSSTSETSKGSGLSLSRSEVRVNRVRARERARERAAKEKERESNHNINSITTQSSSFTELLTSGITNVNGGNSSSSPTDATHDHRHLFQKGSPVTVAQMDYFATGLLNPSSSSSSSRPHHHHHQQIHMGNSGLPMSPFGIGLISGGPGGDASTTAAETLPPLQHFSFVPEQHLIPIADSLNFSIASSGGGLAGFNRGTLQSNSPHPSIFTHHHHHHQRFSNAPMDGSTTNIPFFFSTAAAAPPPMETTHQFAAGFDGRLQLCFGDGSEHSDQKGKGKN